MVLLDGLELHGSGCVGSGGVVSEKCDARKRKADNLQPDLHQVDKPAKLFDDLVARSSELVRPDDLAFPYAAATTMTSEEPKHT